ncbi:hypothetical protein DSECCO2_411420 [anaerobic digester metagenome]
MSVNCTDGIVPLLIHRKVVEDVPLIFGGVLYSGVQHRFIDGADTQKCQFVLLVETGFHLKLKVVVGRQERQADQVKQELQVRAAGRYQKSGVLTQGAVEGKRQVGSADGAFEDQPLGVPVDLPHLNHRTQGISAVGRKSAGIEVHFTDKIHIDDAHRTAGRSLCGKVVEVGNLHTVEIEPVFAGATAAYNNIVAERNGGSHPRQSLYHLADVPVGTRTLFNLPYSQGTHGNRALFGLPEWRGLHHYLFQLNGGLAHRDIHKHRLGIGHLKLFTDVGFKSNGSSSQFHKTGLNPGKNKVSVKVGSGSDICAKNHDIGKRKGLVAFLIENTAPDRSVLRLSDECSQGNHYRQ